MLRNILNGILLLSAVGCAGQPESLDSPAAADEFAGTHGFEREVVTAGHFRLATFHKGLNNNDPELAIYVEGDGRAFLRPNVVAPDPTPRDPVALRMATRDPRASVLYIARPCQYSRSDPACHPRYWTSHRFAEEVVAAVDSAITSTISRIGPRRVHLVGYSGGGAIAALVAARRVDVDSLVTVVGNLDHSRWTSIHGVTPLTGSLNPTDVAANLRHVRQLHLTGGLDPVIPPDLVKSFAREFGDADQVAFEIVPTFDHHCCWAEIWPGPILGPLPE